jgi:hypothetical protein
MIDKLSFNFDIGTRSAMDYLKRLVSEARGEWIGVQTNLAPAFLADAAQLWFKNPATHRSLHISFNPLNFDGSVLCEQVRTRIDLDNEAKSSRSVRVSVVTLKQLAVKLLKLSEEIAALYEEKQ